MRKHWRSQDLWLVVLFLDGQMPMLIDFAIVLQLKVSSLLSAYCNSIVLFHAPLIFFRFSDWRSRVLVRPHVPPLATPVSTNRLPGHMAQWNADVGLIENQWMWSKRLLLCDCYRKLIMRPLQSIIIIIDVVVDSSSIIITSLAIGRCSTSALHKSE